VASFGAEKKQSRKQSAVKYPADHKLGMRVPKNGSDCAKCEYVDGKNCTNTVFVKWNGSEVIPLPIDEYCCDMFETKEKK
jgi:hypothetical protein